MKMNVSFIPVSTYPSMHLTPNLFHKDLRYINRKWSHLLVPKDLLAWFGIWELNCPIGTQGASAFLKGTVGHCWLALVCTFAYTPGMIPKNSAWPIAGLLSSWPSLCSLQMVRALIQTVGRALRLGAAESSWESFAPNTHPFQPPGERGKGLTRIR